MSWESTRLRRRTLLAIPFGATIVRALVACSSDDARPTEQEETEMAGSGTPRRIDYGDDPSQYGELTLPDGTPRGVAVVVHGGFWRAQYGIEYAQPLVPSLVEQGWATWAIEYRRVGNGGGVPETLDDVTSALEKLSELDLGVDLSTATVVGIGHSAGGHLVTWAGAGGVLTHVVSQAGVLDLVAGAGLGGGAVRDFLGHDPGPDDADVDPMQMLPLDVPVWCIHGTGDGIVPIGQSRSYVEAANAAGAVAELVEVPGDHFVLVDPTSDAWSRTLTHLATL